MSKLTKSAGRVLLLVTFLAMSACTPAAPASPTVDANMVFTSAAQTVIAQVTADAAAHPSATPPPPATNTPAAPPPTLPPLGTLPVGTLSPVGTLALIPSATKPVADKALWVLQTPSDGTSVPAGATFNVTWRLRNTGATTWDTTYVYRYYAAVNKLPGMANGYNLTQVVKPNQEVDLTFVAVAPSNPGAYDSTWVITNADNVNFFSFNVKVNVIAATSGPTAEPTDIPVGSAAVTYQDDGGNIIYGGAWTGPVVVPAGPGGQYHHSVAAVASATLNYAGDMNQIRIWYISDPGNGSATVTIDGTAYSFGQASADVASAYWTSPVFYTASPHTIVLTAPGGLPVNVDSFQICPRAHDNCF